MEAHSYIKYVYGNLVTFSHITLSMKQHYNRHPVTWMHKPILSFFPGKYIYLQYSFHLLEACFIQHLVRTLLHAKL